MRGTHPYPSGLAFERLMPNGDGLAFELRTKGTRAACPLCDRSSTRVHSSYSRKIADLPRHGTPVVLRLRARKFFCNEPSCERKIFCERLPEVAAHARKTDRLERALLAIVLELGGRAGARLADELGLLVGRDALLGRAKSAPLPDGGKVRVLGVDDFAFRKGHSYGTILVDLERHKVVDLLPDRSSETLANWLRQHPNLETVSRDRSPTYADGISTGAPQATQVADRWHLMRNLIETLDEFLVGKRLLLKQAAGSEIEGDEMWAAEGSANHAQDDPAAPGPLTPNRPRPGYASQQKSKRKRYKLLVERWKEIRRLQEAGADVADIARKLGMSRPTVYRYKDLVELPEFGQHCRRATLLDPYIPYILKRWEEGCRNGRQLFREIKAQGYSYSESNVGRLAAELRRTDGMTGGSKKRHMAGNAASRAAPGTRHVATLFLRRKEKLTHEQKAYLEQLQSEDEAIAAAYDLAQSFAEMVRNLDGERLDEWLAATEACKGPPALRKFASSLRKDLAAVRAGLTERWSNGPVEGFVHKLKLIKRQGYGRANFDLLRARVMAA